MGSEMCIRDSLKKGCAALSNEPPAAIRTYLNTLWLQDGERWANAEKAAPASPPAAQG